MKTKRLGNLLMAGAVAIGLVCGGCGKGKEDVQDRRGGTEKHSPDDGHDHAEHEDHTGHDH